MSYTSPHHTQFIGRPVIYEAVCASTNSFAAQCLDKTDTSEGAVVITDHQYQGKGQRGNVWYSEPYRNLTFSVILHPTFLTVQQSFSLNIIATLAIQHVLASYVPSGLSLKWPNDIYYLDQKLGGLLIENVISNRKLKASVVGIGLNVNQAQFTFRGPTSLSLVCQRTFSLQQLFEQILARLERNYLHLRAHGIDVLRAAYLKNMYWTHEHHTFQDTTHRFQGIIRGIDARGHLLIEHSDGTLSSYDRQAVTFVA